VPRGFRTDYLPVRFRAHRMRSVTPPVRLTSHYKVS